MRSRLGNGGIFLDGENIGRGSSSGLKPDCVSVVSWICYGIGLVEMTHLAGRLL